MCGEELCVEVQIDLFAMWNNCGRWNLNDLKAERIFFEKFEGKCVLVGEVQMCVFSYKQNFKVELVRILKI